MTERDDIIERAHAEYDALPGTPPDQRSFRPNAELREGPQDAVEMAKAMTGCIFFRWTRTNDGLWCEGWNEEPYKQAAFDQAAKQ